MEEWWKRHTPGNQNWGHDCVVHAITTSWVTEHRNRISKFPRPEMQCTDDDRNVTGGLDLWDVDEVDEGGNPISR